MQTLPNEMEDLRESRKLSEWLIEWIESRNWLRLLAALPALVAAAGVAVFAVFYFGWTPARAAANCLEAGNRAYGAGDFDRARVAFTALTRLNGRSEPEYAYKIALSLFQRGRKEEAVSMLSALAPQDRPGFAPAHQFLARALLGAGGANPQIIRAAEAHLLKALKLDPKNDDMRLLLGQIYASLRQWEEVRKQLSEVVAARPEAGLLLATAHRALGDERAARAWAERAAKHFSTKVEQAAADDPPARTGWAESLLLLKDYETAFAILEAGYRKSASAAYKPDIGRVCAAWQDQMHGEKPLDVASRLRVLQQGLQYAPGNQALLQALAELSGIQGSEGDVARQAVNQMLAAGENAALLHFCLGGLAWRQGDLEKARFHFDAAYGSGNQTPAIANNLAAVLATCQNPDLPRALAIIQPLVEKFPNHPYYRDTRGQILLRLGRYQEAVQDLESSLRQLDDPRATHKALAEAYRKLGMKDLADEHEQRAAAAAPAAPAADVGDMPSQRVGPPPAH